ncbi:MAG: hypothetical protein QXN83_03485 [Nitrososphaerales archaeon]
MNLGWSVYDLIVITEELVHDADPNSDKPVAGAHLTEPFASNIQPSFYDIQTREEGRVSKSIIPQF